MHRRHFLSGSASVGGGGSLAEAEGADAPDEATRRIEKATAAAMAMQRRDWEQGIIAQALLEAGDWLSAGYRAAADRMRAAARARMDVFGYVQGVCGAPNFDRPGIATEGQAFCILMESAGRKVA